MEKLLDPICDMVVTIDDAREEGLTHEFGGHEYAFCSAGCLAKFAKSPGTYIPKVEAWIAAQAAGAQVETHVHREELPVIDAGMREWYKACRCCMHDAYPKVVEQLDAERAANAEPTSGAGICETAESMEG